MSPFLFLAVGLAVGMTLGWFVAQNRYGRALSEIDLLRERASRLDDEVKRRVEAETTVSHTQTAAEAQARERQEWQTRAEEAERQARATGVGLAATKAYHEDAQQQVAVLTTERDAARAEVSRVAEALATAHRDLAGLQSRSESEQAAMQERLDLLLAAREELTVQFSSAAAAALAKNNEQFLQNAAAAFEAHRQMASSELDARKEGIDQMLTPLRLGLGEMNKRVEEVEKARAEAYGQLGEQLRALSEAQIRLDTSTTQLATALRSGSARGRWGELHLRQLLEGSGLLDYADFSEQLGVTGGDGQRQRPDVVVRLPGERSIAVDSKVPLDDYLNAFDATDEATRSQWLVRHAAKVRDHAIALADRKYWESIEGSPPLVVLFLPTDALLADALRCDPALLDTCHRQQVVIATPSTLFAMLKSIGQLWQQEKLTKEVGEIQKLGTEMYDRIGILAEHFEKVGKGLSQATGAYNDAVASLEERLLVTARKLREKGVSSSRTLPDSALVVLDVKPFVKAELRGA